MGVLTCCGNCSASKESASNTANDSKNSIELLNVSYDPTRELYTDFNKSFAKYWKDNLMVVQENKGVQ